MKLSSTALQIAILLCGGGKSIIVHAGVCTEMSINPIENINLDSCINFIKASNIEQCGLSNTECTKLSQFFGNGWQLLNDVAEQMRDPKDESRGRLPVYTKLVGPERMYMYYAQSIESSGCNGGRWYVILCELFEMKIPLLYYFFGKVSLNSYALFIHVRKSKKGIWATSWTRRWV